MNATDRLKAALAEEEAATKQEAEGKSRRIAAVKLIREIHDELRTGNPARPLLDHIERNGQIHAAPGPETARPGPRGQTDFHGRRQRVPRDRADGKLRPTGADAEALARMAKEANVDV